MKSYISEIEKLSVERIEESSSIIILKSIDYLYWVSEGYVDIYITRGHGEKIEGPLYYVTSVYTHNFVFPLYNEKFNKKVYFIIRLNHNSSVLKVHNYNFHKISKIHYKETRKLISNWIINLSKRAIVGRIPDRPLLVESNTEFQLANDSSLSAYKKLCWIQALTKEGIFFSDISILFKDEMKFIPLVKQNWIDLRKDALVKSVSTKFLIDKNLLYDCIVLFNSIICTILTTKAMINKELYNSIKMIETYNQEKMDLNHVESMLANIGNEIVTMPNISLSSEMLINVLNDLSTYLRFYVIPLRAVDLNLNQELKLNKLLHRSQIPHRKVLLTNKWYKHDNGFLLGFKRSNNEPIALIPLDGRKYYFHDPLNKKIHEVNEFTHKHISDSGYEIYPNLSTATNDNNLSINKILKLVKADIFWVLLISLLLSLLQFSLPILSSILIDDVIPNHDITSFYWILSSVFIFISLSYLFTLSRAYSILRVKDKLANYVQISLWDKLFRLPFYFFNKFTVGDLSWRINGATRIKETLDASSNEILLNSIFGFINIAILFYFSIYLAIFSLVLAIIYIYIIFKITKNLLKVNIISYHYQSHLTGILNQIVNGIFKIRTTASEIRAYNFWANAYVLVRKKLFNKNKNKNLLDSIINSVPYTSIFLLFIVTSIFSIHDITAGSFVAFYMAYTALFISISNLSSCVVDIVDTLVNYQGFYNIVETKNECFPPLNDIDDIQGRIDIIDMVFSYPGSSKNVINHLSLKIEPGEFLGIVGPSSIGKSTLIKLLINFYKPKSGHIFIDGKDLIGLDTEAMRSMIGVVFQDDQLLPDTIYRNIVGNHHISEEAVEQIINLVGFSKDLEKMPMGIHTLVNIDSGGLSCGQKQKILIARALIFKPKIIIFDDAMSSMDHFSQNTIINTLNELKITRIIVSHRDSAVKNTDRIIVMDKGKVVEEGTYNSLLASNGYFYKLFKET